MLCRLMEVSVPGFHDHQRRLTDAAPDPDQILRADLHSIHAASRRTYGRPRLVKALRASNHAVGHKRLARLMAEEGLRRCVQAPNDPTR